MRRYVGCAVLHLGGGVSCSRAGSVELHKPPDITPRPLLRLLHGSMCRLGGGDAILQQIKFCYSITPPCFCVPAATRRSSTSAPGTQASRCGTQSLGDWAQPSAGTSGSLRQHVPWRSWEQRWGAAATFAESSGCGMLVCAAARAGCKPCSGWCAALRCAHVLPAGSICVCACRNIRRLQMRTCVAAAQCGDASAVPMLSCRCCSTPLPLAASRRTPSTTATRTGHAPCWGTQQPTW
jgi:hypothetical protein